MPDYLAIFQSGMVTEIHNRYIAAELMQLNKHTEQYGIVLSAEECRSIAECRSELLRDNERIEVGIGAAKRIIEEFCDSGYVDKNNFTDVIEGLLDCFYSLKTDTDDKADDDTVIEFLKQVFEKDAGGDVSKIYFCTAYDEFVNYFKKYGDRPKKSDDRY